MGTLTYLLLFWNDYFAKKIYPINFFPKLINSLTVLRSVSKVRYIFSIAVIQPGSTFFMTF